MPRIIIALLLLAGAAQAQYRFISEVDRTALEVGETVTLTLTFEGAASGVPTPKPPQMSGFNIESGPYKETKFEIVNMRRSSKASFTFILRATSPGHAFIGRAMVEYKGRQYQSKPINLEISPRGAGGDEQATDDVFIRVQADQRDVYPGQQVVLTYKIYFAVQITSPEIVKLPKATGFWTEEFNMPSQMALRDEVIGGRSYKSGIFRRVAVFPTTSGDLTIEPITIKTKVERRDNRRNFTSDPFFRLGRTMEMKEVSSPPVVLRVKALPEEGKPVEFAGAVGQLSLRANLDRTECEAHDAVTLSVILRGEANIKTLPEPKLKIPPDFESFEPKATENISRNGTNIEGTKRFEYVLIPRVTGAQAIPPIYYEYFNPETEQYVTASTPPMSLNVLEPKESVAGEVHLPRGRKRGVETIASDIAFAKTSPGTIYTTLSAPHQSVSFWIFSMVPWFALAALGIVLRKSDRFESGRMSLKRAVAAAMKELTQADKAAAGNQMEEACRRIALALQIVFSVKLEHEPGALTSETIADIGRRKGMQESLIERALEVMKECDRARFTAGLLQTSDVARLVRDAQGIIGELDASRGEAAA